MTFLHDATAKDRTSGTDVREPRELGVSGGIFDLADAIEELRKEPAWGQGDRNAVTLVHEGSLRVVLAALKPGARIGNEDTDGRLTLHVLSGEVRVVAEADVVILGPGRLISLQRDTGWAAEARAESFLLLTISFTGADRTDRR
jgi:quercetin dioxygenase-like cupin family protein